MDVGEPAQSPDTTRFLAYRPRHLDQLADRFGIDADLADTMRIISLVLPFGVSAYIQSELIYWSRIRERWLESPGR